MIQKIFAFNRFPIKKNIFFKIIDIAMDSDKDIHTLFSLSPRPYNRIYVTMSDKELLAIGKRRNIDDVIYFFKKCDAMFGSAEACIIIHVPAMIRQIKNIPSRDDDQKRHTLFTIHFFACLFHELSHANEYSRYLIQAIPSNIFNKEMPQPLSYDEKEKIAESGEQLCLDKFTKFMSAKGFGWDTLADKLFDWEKLDHIIN